MARQEHKHDPQTPLIKRIQKLQANARYREKAGVFVVEGLPILEVAIGQQGAIESIVFCPGLFPSRSQRAVVDAQRLRGVPCNEVSESDFRAISERNNPDGLIALCRTTWRELLQLPVRAADLFVALVGVSDPGNLGTILRTMDAVKAAGLILVGESTNPFHPRTIRASRGTIFTVPMCYCDGMDTVFGWAASNGVQTMATSARADRSFWDTQWPSPLLCIFGNEHVGLDEDVKARADLRVFIPMVGKASSLNLSVAVSVLLYERLRVTH